MAVPLVATSLGCSGLGVGVDVTADGNDAGPDGNDVAPDAAEIPDAGLPDDGSIGDGPDAAPVDPLVGAGPATLVVTGFMFVEGPQWVDARGSLIFSDIP